MHRDVLGLPKTVVPPNDHKTIAQNNDEKEFVLPMLYH